MQIYQKQGIQKRKTNFFSYYHLKILYVTPIPMPSLIDACKRFSSAGKPLRSTNSSQKEYAPRNNKPGKSSTFRIASNICRSLRPVKTAEAGFRRDRFRGRGKYPRRIDAAVPSSRAVRPRRYSRGPRGPCRSSRDRLRR